MQLLIMAGGMGSRFGGLKQVAPMGPNDEFLIDYSAYDCLRAGFDKIVFVIKEENYELFKSTIGSRIEPHINVEYVFQKLEDVPDFVQIPKDRVKPWGTAHAVLSAKDAITDKFIIINADDFYGFDAFKVAAEFLKNSEPQEYATIGYKVKNTLTENGAVKRGVLFVEENKKLDKLVESSIEKKDGKIIAQPLNNEHPFEISEDTLVSMNMLAFDQSIFSYLEKGIVKFFEQNKDDLSKCEFLIPDVISESAKEYAKVYVLDTEAKWYGVTYKEDTELVRKSIKEAVESREYPNNLWEDR